jgi:hypothetical protein
MDHFNGFALEKENCFSKTETFSNPFNIALSIRKSTGSGEVTPVHVVKQCSSQSDVRITRMIYSRESISRSTSSRCGRCEPFLSSVTKKLQLL